MRTLNAAAGWLFVLCLPLLLLSASLAWAVNSHWLYQYGFSKYDVGATTGLADSELEKVAYGLIGYFNSGEEYIELTVTKNNQSLTLFNQREIIHLKDVKTLVWLDYRVLAGTLIYVLGYAGGSVFWRKGDYRRRLGRNLVIGGGLTLAIMAALGIGALLDFNWLFLQFHLLSFANDFWQLDPTRDYLLMFFPGGFWFDAVLFVVLATVGMALVLSAGGGAYLLRTRKRLSS
ncbi:MAG: TIGR01906 family membrane protein [Chloroflexi bacterium]|nr:TIGR01906 family membrane protein [Chloroflexota bacterium]